MVSTIFIFTRTWGNDPIWLRFFKRVETTNQLYLYIHKYLVLVRAWVKVACWEKFLIHTCSMFLVTPELGNWNRATVFIGYAFGGLPKQNVQTKHIKPPSASMKLLWLRKSLIWALVLLALIIYFFAILFTQATRKEPEENQQEKGGSF